MEREIVEKGVYKLHEVASQCGFASGDMLIKFLEKYQIFDDGFPALEFHDNCFELITYPSFDEERQCGSLELAATIITDKGISFITELKNVIFKYTESNRWDY